MYKGAIRSILSELHRRQDLIVVNDFQCASVKTKSFISQMKELNLSNALIVMHEIGEAEYLASRNLIDFNICMVEEMNPVLLLSHDKVVMTSEAVKLVEEQFQ